MKEKEEKMNEKMRKKLMKVESFLKKKMMNFLRKKENEKVKENLLKVGEKTRKKERKSVGVVVMNKSIKNNSISFDFKHQDKMTNMNSFKIFKVVPEIFEMLNCRFIQGCDLVDFLLEGPEQSNIFSFKLLQDTFNLRSVNFHIESHHLLNSSKLIGFFLPDLSSLAVCPIDSTTSLATDSLTSLLSSSEISEISSIFFFNCSSFTSLNVSTNACLATEDQLIQSVLSISDFNSLGTDSVIAPIFNLQSNYLYYLYTKDIFKSFGEKKLNVSNFKLQSITQAYSSLQEGGGLKIEFKESLGRIDKDIVAFSNASGGRIFLGVSDDCKIKGIAITNKLKSGIQNIARNCGPSIKIKLEAFENILNKNFPSAACQYCKKVTNIQFSNDFRKLVARNRILSEINKTLRENWYRWMNVKNGQIEAMHKMTAELTELIPEEQKKKAKEVTQEMRDEIKYTEKRFIEKFKDIRKVYKPERYSNNNIFPGDSKGSPDESFSKDTLVFIDANFLSKLSKHFGDGKHLVYDLIRFSENLSRKQNLNCKNIFYYTAPPFQCKFSTPEEEKKRDGYYRFINKLKEKGVIVREGRCQRLKCEEGLVYKQKAVDILLAMDLMSVPLKYPGIKRIIFISSDSDFVPIVKNLEENWVRTILYTYYEKIRDTPFSVSNHLIKSVHKYVLLTKEDFVKVPLEKGEK